MPIAAGDTLPDATFLQVGADGPEQIRLTDRVKGRKVVLFGLPGAYTGTCTTAHVPSFIRTIDAFRAKGIEEVICVSVNDPFVMANWGKDTGATKAGITMLADPGGDFAKAMDMVFSAPPAGLLNRSRRYALWAEDGVVQAIEEDAPGTCDRSGGESLLERL